MQSSEQLPGIASFWRSILGAAVKEAPAEVTVSFAWQAEHEQQPQQLIFAVPAGCEGLPVAYSGWHLALYIRDFEATCQRALAAGLVFDNARFSDRGGSLELALQHAQFRTLCMGAAGPECELEIRSMLHPACPL